MQELEQAGYKAWWPMKEYMGKDAGHNKITRDVFCNMKTQQIFRHSDGWNGELPDQFRNSGITTSSKKYTDNYSQIKWED